MMRHGNGWKSGTSQPANLSLRKGLSQVHQPVRLAETQTGMGHRGWGCLDVALVCYFSHQPGPGVTSVPNEHAEYYETVGHFLWFLIG